jgi:PPM family protein phosphatase
MDVTLRFSVQSQVGVRSHNEDAAYAGPRLLALADGVGGHAAGEVAASLAITELLELDKHPASRDLLADLRTSFQQANSAILQRVATERETFGMATTLTALLFDGDRAALGHIGDSRAYLWRDGSMQQITHDDTMVQSLVDVGRITPDEAWRHPQRNLVTKVLTGDPIEPSFEVRGVDPGDRYLICSDGVSDYVPIHEIASVLSMDDPLRAPQELIRRALSNGGGDNVTCIVADVVEGQSGYNIAILSGAPGPKACVVEV